jgi:outer membrane protein
MLSASAGAVEFGARGFLWMPKIEGTMRADKDGIKGDNVDMKDDLGLDDELTYSVEVYAGGGNHHFSVMYTPLDYSASASISRPITFNGQAYQTNSVVDSSFKINMFDGEYRYDLVNLENALGGFSFGLLGRVRYIDGETRMSSAELGEQKRTFTAVLPMVGAGLHIGLIANILEARVNGAWTGYSGNQFYDASAEISVTPFPFLDIHAGYRVMKLELDDISDIYADVDCNGPFVGISIGF